METVTFAELGLSPKVLAAVEAAGYTSPTPIQAQAIPVAVTGRDVLGIAQTGTGKTAAFVIPMITRLETGRARARMPRSLILAPTRELAAQVAQSFEKYGVNHKLNVALLIGGVSMDEQVKKLDRGVDVLIATPGRMLDHFQRGRLMLMGVEILVIDEADRMLDMGFIPDIEKICKLLPPRRQTLFFSATMPAEITRLVDTFLKDPMRVEVARPATTAKTITQRFYYCASQEDWDKREMLRQLIRGETVRNAIIFCNRKRDVAILHKSLLKHGFNAGALHGDMDQKARMETLDKFRSGEILFLAASDVAARGLDIPDVSHVFNFDVPWAGDDYVHRIGRTGRAGREGFSATIVSPEDLRLIKDIEKVTGEQPTWIGEPPTAEDIADSGKRRRGRGARPGAGRRDARPERSSERRAEGRPPRQRERQQRERRPEAPLAPTEAPIGEIIEAGNPQAIEPAVRAERSHRGDRRDRRPDRPPRRERAPMAADAPQPQIGSDVVPMQQAERPARRPRPDEPAREPRPDTRPGADSRQGERPVRAEAPQRTGQVERNHRTQGEPRPQRERQAGGGRGAERSGERTGGRGAERGERPTGFADNVPAFLRKPVRAAT